MQIDPQAMRGTSQMPITQPAVEDLLEGVVAAECAAVSTGTSPMTPRPSPRVNFEKGQGFLGILEE